MSFIFELLEYNGEKSITKFESGFTRIAEINDNRTVVMWKKGKLRENILD